MERYFLRRHPYPRSFPRSTLSSLLPDAYGVYGYHYKPLDIAPLGARPLYPALNVLRSASQLESGTPWQATLQPQTRQLPRAGVGKALQNLKPITRPFKVSQKQGRNAFKTIESTFPEDRGKTNGKRSQAVRKPVSRRGVGPRTRQKGAIKGRIGPHIHQKGTTTKKFPKKFFQQGSKALHNVTIKKSQLNGPRRRSVKYDPLDLATQVRALHDLWWNGPGSGIMSVELHQAPLLRPQPKWKEATRKYEVVADSSLKNRRRRRNKNLKMLSIEEDTTQSLFETRDVGSKKPQKRKNTNHRLPTAEENTNSMATWWPLVGSTTGANMPREEVMANENKFFGTNVEVKEEEVDLDVPIVVQGDACKYVVDFLSNVDRDVEVENLTAEEEKEREEEGFLFFSNLFEENPELKSLYVDNCNGGMFDCLICHSIGENKSFDKLLSLVMHATSRVKRRPEHRGYGRAVCSILGWSTTKF